MKKIALILVLVVSFLHATEIETAQSGNWNESATWTGGTVPASEQDVKIGAGHVIAIINADAACKTLTFGDETAKLNLSTSSSVLSVYGDFTPDTTAHVPFSYWEDGAKLCFVGVADTQRINNIRNANTYTDMAFFKTIEVNKDSGVVTFAGSSDSKLNITNALIVKSGTFFVPAKYDINGRSFDGIDFAHPEIIVESNGTFKMQGDASQIVARCGSDMQSIGKMTVYGTAIMASSSSNRIRIADIDVEDGGFLFVPYYSEGGNMTSEKFDAGTILVKSGGLVKVSLNTDIWYTDTQVALLAGGEYEATSSTPTLPDFSTNQGTVVYSRTSTSNDQTIVDMDYHNLEIKYANEETSKIWTLAANRVVDSLATNNSAKLVLNAATAQTLSINKILRLTSGCVDNSDANIIIQMADNSIISRATGFLQAALLFDESVNLRYTSSVDTVTTGWEVPEDEDILKDFECNSSTGVKIDRNITVNGFLEVSKGAIYTGDYTIHLASGATLSETDSCTVLGNIRSSQSAMQNTTADFGEIGMEITPIDAAMGATTVRRVTGQCQNLGEDASILRYFEITPTSNTNLNATIAFKYDCSELNGIIEDQLGLYVSNDGENWAEVTSQWNATEKTVNTSGLASVCYLTLGQKSESAVSDDPIVLSQFNVTDNFPNPFNPTTTIQFTIPSAGIVQLDVYSLQGKCIESREMKMNTAGNNYFIVNAENWSSGVYLYQVSFNGKTINKKMAFVK